MITGKEDLIPALIEAYLMEKGTMEFYAYASDKTLDPGARDIFLKLSGWEEKHMQYIQFLYQSLINDLDIVGFEKFKERAYAADTESGIPVKELESKIDLHSFAGDLEAISLAMEIEDRAYNLYKGLSGKAADTNVRVVFQEMMEQELKHMDYLKNLKTRLLIKEESRERR